jgi:FlaA1/EpsC-like NDP-sugar epimerase
MISSGRIKKRLISLPRRQKQSIALVLDIVMSLTATWLAFSFRLDTEHYPVGYEWVPYGLSAVLFIPFFVKFGLYRAIFRYSGASSLASVFSAVLLYGASLFAILVIAKFPAVPRSIGILQPILFFSMVFGSRVVASQLLKRASPGTATLRNVLIYGAGEAGAQASESLAMTPEYRVCGFLDDDRSKHNRQLHGHPVLDPANAAGAVARYGITEILIALPSAGTARRREIINALADLQVRVRTIPGILDLARGNVLIGDIQELQIIDLLERAPISSPLPDGVMSGKTVLVTGAGGSIGSELCRQILALEPAKLVILDHSEFGLYSIDAELRSMARKQELSTQIVSCLGSVRDERRVSGLFERHRPHLVYHAAAYKHVPLVEANPVEAATNNIVGTANVARAAERAGSERFTLISTDKAVRPTNFMGASKRLAEQVVQALAAKPGQKTIFSMVRFGNVLGSSGSVVPLFRRQIEAGGPVTITHPDVVRYFMTIPEAVGLVLHSSQMAAGGEVFVLDMGDPVKIIDLARKMIRLSGRIERTPENPDGDIEITIIGLRPGEKLYEELLIGDDPQPTANRHIMMAREICLPPQELERQLARLDAAIEAEDVERLAEILSQTVAGFRRGGDAAQPAHGHAPERMAALSPR